MKNINLNISTTLYDTKSQELPSKCRQEEQRMTIEDSSQSIRFKTLKSLSQLQQNIDTPHDENLKNKFKKASNWINDESTLNENQKEKVCKWLNKDLPFYFLECNKAVKVSENLTIEQDGEGWINPETNETQGFSGSTLHGSINIEYNFEALSVFFDELVNDFKEHHGFAVPNNVFSIIDLKETVDACNKIDFKKDDVLKFYNLTDSDVKIEINNNNGNIKNKVKTLKNK
jgi:hypothetical protein